MMVGSRPARNNNHMCFNGCELEAPEHLVLQRVPSGHSLIESAVDASGRQNIMQPPVATLTVQTLTIIARLAFCSKSDDSG